MKKPTYDEFCSSIAVERVQRDVTRCCARYAIDLTALSRADVKAVYDEVARRLILQLQAKVASKKYEVKTVRFPASAWDAVKDEIASWCRRKGFHRAATFFRERVTHTEVTMEANAYHPSIAIPDHETFVEIMIIARNRAFRDL